MEALGFSRTERRTFHDTEYVLAIAGDTESISIEVEHAEDGRRWRAKFAARFIEEITQRTGNAKKFDVFVRMLLSALAQESDAVYLDVLTARDLEMLRRHANPQGPPTTSTATQSDKRYMILTYRAEFDKVHYPLPLPLDERSEEELLRCMVARLKSELSQAHATISQLEEKACESGASATTAEEERVAKLQRQNAELSDALQAVRKESEQLRTELRLRTSGSQPTSHHKDDEVHRLKSELARSKAEIKSMKDELRQRENAQRRNRDKESLELKSEKQKADRLQAQVRKLEEEKRSLGMRLQAASRGQSAERSRPAARTPSADRCRPPSRPVSGSRQPSRPPSRQPPTRQPSSRASSLASSRERTPSPSSFIAGGRGRPSAMGRSGSPGLREDRREAYSPGATLSPYRRPSGPPAGGRRTPSPGTRSRERTPSPGSQRGGAVPLPSLSGLGSGGAAPRSSVSLHDRGTIGAGGQKPVSSRYGNGGSRPSSASRGAGVRQANAAAVAGGLDAAEGHVSAAAAPSPPHQPGSLFGLAANLGLGPGASPGAAAGGVSSSLGGSSAEDAPACDIDVRLQALQSFLKQTKNISS
eukprot:TRINITY_DN3377_c0_g2_i4.p1 TRINITY_DN3377_c0_g2~~TRINITY_DN3377_c0_g2_i4.p1  ORF type:complete len:589 (-),score=117.16 TRINITY_DN3377_c0_g2_i4:122-1888(-)